MSTGQVRIDPLLQATPSTRAAGASVNVRHWHGATRTTAVTHIAIQEALDGEAVRWMEQVTNEQYGAIGVKS